MTAGKTGETSEAAAAPEEAAGTKGETVAATKAGEKACAAEVPVETLRISGLASATEAVSVPTGVFVAAAVAEAAAWKTPGNAATAERNAAAVTGAANGTTATAAVAAGSGLKDSGGGIGDFWSESGDSGSCCCRGHGSRHKDIGVCPGDSGSDSAGRGSRF